MTIATRLALTSALAAALALGGVLSFAGMASAQTGGASCNFGTADMAEKSRGVFVRSLQTALINKGYAIPAGVTGYFGPATKAAVIKWQRAVGVSPAEGYFGAKSRAKQSTLCGGGSRSVSEVSAGLSASEGIAIMLPQQYVYAAGPVSIPVHITKDTPTAPDLTGAGVHAIEFQVVYDSKVLVIDEVTTGGSAIILQNGTSFVQANAQTPGIVIIGIATTEPVSGSGLLLTLKGRTVGKGTSVLKFESINNDNNAPVFLKKVNEGSVPARFVNGSFVYADPAIQPTITALTPNSAVVGSGNVEVTITGTNFTSASVANVNSLASIVARETTYVDSQHLKVTLLGSEDLWKVTPITISVSNAGSDGSGADVKTSNEVAIGTIAPGTVSNEMSFTVLPRTVVAAPAPTISALNPSSITVGSGATQMVVTGTGFTATSTVNVDAVAEVTRFVSPTQLVVTIPASKTSSARVLAISVTGAGKVSNVLNATVTQNAYPALTVTSPASGDAWQTGTIQKINWTMQNVPAGHKVNLYLQNSYNGSLSRWISYGQISADAGSYSWTVPSDLNPTATEANKFTIFGKVDGPANLAAAQDWSDSFSIVNTSNASTIGAPIATSLGSVSAVAGSSSFTVVVNGSRFSANSRVHVRGEARPTTFISENQLRGTLTASDLASPASLPIMVVTPSSGSTAEASSGLLYFTVTAPTQNPTPGLDTIEPSTVTAGGGSVSLTVNGPSRTSSQGGVIIENYGYTKDSVVKINGVARPTTMVSVGKLVATIPASDLTNPGTLQISVTTPAPGGGTSRSVPLMVTPSASTAQTLPTITSITPSSLNVGSSPQDLLVNGSGFVAGSLININGTPRVTPYSSIASQLVTRLLPEDTATARTLSVTVTNPGQSGTSNTKTLSVVETSIPTITLTSPPTMSPATLLSDVVWNAGTDHMITWTTKNISSGNKVNIALVNESGFYSYLSSYTVDATAGSFKWTIDPALTPRNASEAKAYAIDMTVISPSGIVIARGRSSNFTIVNTVTQSASVLNAIRSLVGGSGSNQSGFRYVWNNDLQIGSQNVADVTALQTALTKEGVYTGDITGGFYDQTYIAVKKFQQKYGISPISGYVGALTRAKLNQLFQ